MVQFYKGARPAGVPSRPDTQKASPAQAEGLLFVENHSAVHIELDVFIIPTDGGVVKGKKQKPPPRA